MSSVSTTARLEGLILSHAVKDVIRQMDKLLVEFIGASAIELSGAVYRQWQHGRHVDAASLRVYAYSLATQLDDPAHRRVFMFRAERLLLRLRYS